VFLRASPIDVSTIVRELLLDRMQTTVLTSATLTVDGAFDYIRSRLGIRTAAEIRLPSEFRFEEQAILYLPRKMPDPRSDTFATAAGREVIEILKRTRGRAFRAVHQLRHDARGAGDRRDGARLPHPVAGDCAAVAAAESVPDDAARRVVCDLRVSGRASTSSARRSAA
jgi:ATP-dependent DNA helicase DinG